VLFNYAMLRMLFHSRKDEFVEFLHGDYKDVPEYEIMIKQNESLQEKKNLLKESEKKPFTRQRA
jgi:hypothetical protein